MEEEMPAYGRETWKRDDGLELEHKADRLRSIGPSEIAVEFKARGFYPLQSTWVFLKV